MVKWEELEREHLLKPGVELKDVQHGHIARAFDKDGVTKCICCGRASPRGDFPRFCREACTMSNKGLNRRHLLNQARSLKKLP